MLKTNNHALNHLSFVVIGQARDTTASSVVSGQQEDWVRCVCVCVCACVRVCWGDGGGGE